MPRQNDYPRWRYLTMQASMWVILLGTVGVAALTSHYKRGSLVVKLGEPRLIDSISVRLPKGWKISEEPHGLRAAERTNFRFVVSVRERDPESLTLLERFMQGVTTTAPTKRGVRGSTIQIGPATGVVTIISDVVADDGRFEIKNVRATAKAVMPNQHEVTILVGCYDTDGSNLERAIEVMKLVAESVQYAPPK